MPTIVFGAFHSAISAKLLLNFFVKDPNKYVVLRFNAAYYDLLWEHKDEEDLSEIKKKIAAVMPNSGILTNPSHATSIYNKDDYAFASKMGANDVDNNLKLYAKFIRACSELIIEQQKEHQTANEPLNPWDIFLVGDLNLFNPSSDKDNLAYYPEEVQPNPTVSSYLNQDEKELLFQVTPITTKTAQTNSTILESKDEITIINVGILGIQFHGFSKSAKNNSQSFRTSPKSRNAASW